MRILCFSDLHIPRWCDYLTRDKRYLDWGGFTKIKPLIDQSKPDVIVATGDLVDPRDIGIYYEILDSVFGGDIPLITTLGNHEFWGRSFAETRQLIRAATEDSKHNNIHCLDVCNYHIIDNTLFVGGMLFFDGSMRWRENQGLYPLNGWNDCYISDLKYGYNHVCSDYIQDISENVALYAEGRNTILCTHHVPHEDINAHEPSPYSFYSGTKNILKDLKVDPSMSNVSISGHTHKRCVGKQLENFLCVNVGKSEDEYDINYFCLEV